MTNEIEWRDIPNYEGRLDRLARRKHEGLLMDNLERRKGPKLRATVINHAAKYTLDIQISRWLRTVHKQKRLDNLRYFVATLGGDTLDSYNGPTMGMLKVRVYGMHLDKLLRRPEVWRVDISPEKGISEP